MSFPLGAEVRKARARELLRFPARLGDLAVRFLGEAEIGGALDGHFLCHVGDLAHDVEIVFLRFLVDHAIAGSDHLARELLSE